MNEKHILTFAVPIVFILLVMFVLPFASAFDEYGASIAQQILNDNVPCSSLSDDQLESLGDYYMEQMHPGELHGIMEERIGGEGSDSLRTTHVTMGQMFYCGNRGAMSAGMMNMMMGRSRFGGTNMMGTTYWANGMMGTWYGGGFFSVTLLWILVIALAGFVFGLAFWLAQRLLTQNKKR